MRVKLLAASAAMAMAAGGGAVAAATAASAASAQILQAALYANGTSTAFWSGYGDPVLTAGSTSGDSAQVDLSGSYAGQQAPGMAPSFTADHYSAGDPRWVIELHNGCSVFGSPTAANSSTFTWAANPGGPQATDYNTAIGWAQNCGQDDWVTAAFIVDDSGYAGTAVTLQDVQYDDQYLPNPDTITGYAGKKLDDYRSGKTDGTRVDLYTGNGTPAQTWTVEPDGAVVNAAAGTGMCLDDPDWAGKGAAVDFYQCPMNNGQVDRANDQWYRSGSHLVNEANGLCLNDPGYATANGTQQILWTCGNYANENYTQP